LPESINDGTLPLSDVVVVPVPSLGVDWLTDTTQYSEGAEVMGVDMVFTETTEETNCSGSGVKLGNLVLLNGLPVAGWGGVNRRRFKDGCGDTVEKRSVDDVTDGMGEIEGCAGAEYETYVWPVIQPTSAIQANLSSG